MEYPHQIDKQTLITATGTYGRCVSGATGNITKVRYKSDTVADGDCTLDILLNGVSIYASPGDRPVIVDGQQEVSLAMPIIIPVVEMDNLEFTAELEGGSIGNAFYTQLTVKTADGAGNGSITFDDGGPDTDGFFIFDEGYG